MLRASVFAVAMALVACSNTERWQGRVYSSKAPHTDFIPVGDFATLQECRDAGTSLVNHMRLGQNGAASRDYFEGKTVCTKV